MAKVVNLARFRKSKARAQARAKADENSVKFGRSKSQKELEAAENSKAKRDLDGHSLSDE